MKIVQRSRFKSNPLVARLVLAATSLFAASVAYGNAGYGVNTDISGTTFAVPTYYANSPQGLQPALDPVTHLPLAGVDCNVTPASCVDTGTALRKFVDPLAGVDGAGIPLAITTKWVNPAGVTTGDDYYEIAIVQYTQQMHQDLAKPTLLRGYVQVETPAVKAAADAAGVKSESIPLFYPDGITPILDANGKQVIAVHAPHYLGPIIIAQRGTAVRMKYTNYLPYNDSKGLPVGAANGGELPIPVDTYLAGGGPGVDKNGNPLTFSENRAEIHWHGGDTPWISDGTPHQWVAPANDKANTVDGMGKGQSYQNVPDMPDPGPGSGTLYFPNNISARLMFYHDHTSGLTRLNVYVGEAAGYVVQDPVEKDLVTKGIIPNTLLGVGIPLVIQDKTFVPKNIGAAATANNGGIQSQDAKWDLTHWGQPGDLWFPHVYETNQDPNSIDGTNPVGRWDWGPWFWPVFPSQYSLPSGNYGDVTTTPEAFVDTPIVNGQAYPTLTVDPIPTRFRILHVPNDRSGNYSIFEAVDANGKLCDANPASLTYNATPAVAALAPGQTGALAACTEVRMVPAAATAGYPATWPTDARAGGVPDPATAGPDIIQIANEGGLLPAPAIWPAQPVTYDQNVRSMTVFNVLNHALLLGGAERADVIVDFSKYAGKTLILYNDAPAPMPGFDPRIDYFTGDGDQTVGGGAYNTLPGYGPNTRTVLQIKVNSTVGGATQASTAGTAPVAFDLPALQAALPVAYAASQPAPNVPESVYNKAFGTNNPDNYPRIFTGSNTQPEFSFSAPGYMIAPGTGAAIVNTTGINYTSVPTVTILGQLPTVVTTSTDPLNGATVGSNGPAAGATAHAILSGGTNGTVTGIVIDTVGAGYLTKPTIVISGGGATVQATATLTSFPTQIVSTVHVINKAIQELFDPVYGRMNATLAVELPYSSSQIATTIPLAYIDAPIESTDTIKDGETQIWKITHNGVDSHPVHFHLVNVQVLARVDWAGVVKPPQANEVGWKETLRMNPLEDVYVAVRAVHPVVPFGLPKSQRTLDPSQAIGSQTGFTQIDQMTGNAPVYQNQILVGGQPVTTFPVPTDAAGAFLANSPFTTAAYSNQITDFDNEYVWHCHILGHEENDFMRPFIFHPTPLVPDEPGTVTITGNTVTWVDPTPYGGQDSAGVPTAGINSNYVTPTSSMKNEVGFTISQLTTVTGVTSTVVNATRSVRNFNATNVTTVSVPLTVTKTPGTGRNAGNTVLTWSAVAGATNYTVTYTTPSRRGPPATNTATVNSSPTNIPSTGTLVSVVANTVTGVNVSWSAPILGAGSVLNNYTVTYGGGTTATQTTTSLSNVTPAKANGLTVVANVTTTTPGVIAPITSTVSVNVPANTTTWAPTATSAIQNVAGSASTANPTVAQTANGSVTTTLTTTVSPVTVVAYNAAGVSTNAVQLSKATDGTNAAAAAGTLTAAATVLINNAANVSAVTGPAAPTGLTETTVANATTGLNDVVLSWTAVPGATGYLVTYGNPSTVASIQPVVVTPAVPATATTAAIPAVTTVATSFTIPAAQANATASVVAVLANGTQVLTSAASSSVYTGAALAPVGLAVANPTPAVTGAISLTWANNPTNVNNVTSFTLAWTGTTSGSATFTGSTSKGATVTGLTSGGSYSFSLTANAVVGNSPAASLPAAITAP